MLRNVAKRIPVAASSGSISRWRRQNFPAYPTRNLFSSSVLPDTLDRSSESYARNSETMEGLVSQLDAHIRQVMNGGGPDAVKRKQTSSRCSFQQLSTLINKLQLFQTPNL